MRNLRIHLTRHEVIYLLAMVPVAVWLIWLELAVKTGGAFVMAAVLVQCAHCSAWIEKEVGAVNRAAKSGLSVYCDRECAGLARRRWKSEAQRKLEKQAYDARRRIELADEIKASKAAYHKRTYDPVAAAVQRQKRMPSHVEYCRRPEYREWKREYDQKYRASKEYGEFAECFLLTMAIREECLSQQSDYEIRYARGGIGRTQQRRREYVRAHREEPEIGPLGNLELRQGRQNGSLTS